MPTSEPSDLLKKIQHDLNLSDAFMLALAAWLSNNVTILKLEELDQKIIEAKERLTNATSTTNPNISKPTLVRS